MSVMTYDKLAAVMPIMMSDPVNRQHPSNFGRVGWWLVLKETYGGRFLYDLMGYNHGTLTGMANTTNGWRPSFQPGAIGGSILCDGANGYIESPKAAVITYPFTMIIWAKLTAVPTVNSSDNVVFAIGRKSTLDNFFVSYYRTSSGVNQLRAVAQSSGGAAVMQYITTPTIDTQWHWIGAVYTNNTTAKVYLDGEPLNASSLIGSATPGSVDTTWIGGLIYNSTILYGLFNGQLNDATVFNRALSDNEMRLNYDLSCISYPGVLNRLPLTMFHSGGLISPGSMPIFASPILNPAIIQGTTRYVA